jgi:biotin carboxyl carrier protein
MYKALINNKEFKVEINGDKKTVDGKDFIADVVELKKGKFHILRNDKSYSAEVVDVNRDDRTVTVKINHTEYLVSVKDQYADLLQQLGMDKVASAHKADIKAPMPGLVLSVMVEQGQKVSKGDAIIVLEAMKMENILKAPADGEVKKIIVKKGDKVEKNQVMIEIS